MFRRPWLLLIWLLVVTATEPESAEQLFTDLDSNHDGQIDKPEFSAGLDRLWSLGHEGGGSFWKSVTAKSTAGKAKVPAYGTFWKAFTSTVAMIVATEIGDKTFFIAAVLSMKYDRSAVFIGAISALVVMTILSTAMGFLLPNILSRQYTHLFGALLFLYFGVRLLSEARGMQAGKASEELEEVEEELLMQSNKKAEQDVGSAGEDDVEQQKSSPRQRRRQPSRVWYHVAMQAVTLTFVAEWGDRSQIATIALAASNDPLGVTVGGCLGHSFCTGLAVLGGRMLAARISEKTVHLAGGALFLLFGLHSLFLEE